MNNVQPISLKKDAILSYRQLRQTIGVLGLALPLLVYVTTVVVGACDHVQDSISSYYYTTGNVWFIGIFWGLGLVLLFYPSYKGELVRDAVFTSISGLCAICVSLFPTNSRGDSCAMFAYRQSDARAAFHYLCAASMLLIFSYMSVFIFTRTTLGNNLLDEKNRWKRRRNAIYVTCGVLTLASIISLGILSLLKKNAPPTTFWFEVFALVPFGVSWLIKGGFAFTDKDETSTLGSIGKLFKG